MSLTATISKTDGMDYEVVNTLPVEIEKLFKQFINKG